MSKDELKDVIYEIISDIQSAKSRLGLISKHVKGPASSYLWESIAGLNLASRSATYCKAIVK